MGEQPRSQPSRATGRSIELDEAKTSGTTFTLHDVTASPEVVPETDPRSAIEALAGSPVESCSDYRGTLVACRFHPLVAATWAAFDGHRPLILSPDMIWLAIAQGIATHVNENAAELRGQFVSHAVKAVLVVRRDDFVKGSPENPWGEVIDDFSRQIGDRIGPRHALLVPDFTTTGPVDRVASEIVLMGAMRAYFDYELHTRCGIPKVTLEGTPEDWAKIRSRLDDLDDLGLSWWSDVLRPILDQFVAAARGNPDRTFWCSIFKKKQQSGGPYLTGWLLRLFPYLQNREYGPAPSYRRTGRWLQRRNPFLSVGSDEEDFAGVTTENLSSGLCKAPFQWEYLGTRFDYEFIAGLIGVEQDRLTMGLRPKIGWAAHPV